MNDDFVERKPPGKRQTVVYFDEENEKLVVNNMAYDKTTDLYDIQADVLTSDLSENPKISKLKQLKTENKVFTKALNATFEQLGNAQTSAADAMQRVEAVENELAELKANGIGTGTGGGTQVVVDGTTFGVDAGGLYVMVDENAGDDALVGMDEHGVYVLVED